MKPKTIYRNVTKIGLALAMISSFCSAVSAQYGSLLKVRIDSTTAYQTLHNFGASDAWAAQYVGNWPDKKKNAIADLLFSTAYDIEGQPMGIGLSAWRFNIGAGSAAQGDKSGIKDPWRRTEGFLQEDGSYNWQNQSGQQWFLKAAKDNGVEQFIAFVNSPPIQLTKNGRAHSDDGLSANLSSNAYEGYANFLAKVYYHFEKEVGVSFDHISPFNEPQWEWKGGQEGSPWNNEELAAMTKVLDAVFKQEKVDAQIEITEAGQIDYLTGKKEKHSNRDNQIEAFFDSDSPNYIGNLQSVAPQIAAHSYFTTWPIEKLKNQRERIAKKLLKYPDLEYMMSEYCILENNDEIKGETKDLGMQTALYVARIIHADLTIANASAWHWWLAMSPYDFKDGLIYHDKEKLDGNYSDSKLLWALGNYSRFIRPGAKRIKVVHTDFNEEETLKEGVLISAYKNTDNSVAIVAINQKEKEIDLKFNGLVFPDFNTSTYVTDESYDLHLLPRTKENNGSVKISGKSVTTLVLKVD